MRREDVKDIVLSLKVVYKDMFPCERVVRDVISELAFQDIVYAPIKKNGSYRRIEDLNELSDDDRKLMARYQKQMLKGAINTIRRARKLKKWLIGEENRKLMGELELEMSKDD